jgi:hypothetical protein
MSLERRIRTLETWTPDHSGPLAHLSHDDLHRTAREQRARLVELHGEAHVRAFEAEVFEAARWSEAL